MKLEFYTQTKYVKKDFLATYTYQTFLYTGYRFVEMKSTVVQIESNIELLDFSLMLVTIRHILP
jgi:hypothetical protein